MEHAHTLTAGLPTLYTTWLSELLSGPIPAELDATCDNCAMLPTADTIVSDSVHYFYPHTKCCTYLPRIPNFSVGRILLDDDPAAMAGRESVEARIRAGGAVTPLALEQSSAYGLKYKTGGSDIFGRMTHLRCPHYVEDQGGLCGIWKNRESVCTTWFCKHNRGMTGGEFWRTLQEFLSIVEKRLAHWCAFELKISSTILRQLTRVPDADKLLTFLEMEEDEARDTTKAAKVWGKWHGRESEFYQACATMVNPLHWSDVEHICGVEMRTYVSLLQDKHRDLLSTEVPAHLKMGRYTVVERHHDYVVVVHPTNGLHPFTIPDRVLELLSYFDGRPTEDITQTIAKEKNLQIKPDLIRKLVDFEVLTPTCC